MSRTTLEIMLIILVGLGGSFFILNYVNNEEMAKNSLNFKASANKRLSLIDKNITSDLSLLQAARGFFQATGKVTRKSFSIFFESITQNNQLTSLQALSWNPLVKHNERQQLEIQAKEAGFSNFHFTERGKDNKLIEAKQRQEYIPVYYIEPYMGNEGALGFDLTSSTIRLEALNKARNSGQTVASEAINLVQLKKDKTGVLIFNPVYSKNVNFTNIVDRRRSLLGYAVGVIKVKALITGSIAHSNEKKPAQDSLDIYVYDLGERNVNGVEPSPLLYFNNSNIKNVSENPKYLSLAEARSDLFLERTVNIGDRNWLILARPSEGKLGYRAPLFVWLLFFFCLLLTLLFAYLRKNVLQLTKTKSELSLISEKALNAETIARIGHLDWNLVTNNITWSKGTYQLFGFDEDFQPTIESTVALIHPDDAVAVNKGLNDAVLNKQDYDIIHRMIKPDGSIITVQAKGKLTCNKQGDSVRLLGTIVDLTEQIAVQNKLANYRDRLEEMVAQRTAKLETLQQELLHKEKLASLGQITATVSHELRNPLGAIRPSLHILKKYNDPTNQLTQRAIERMERSITSCDSIIDELLHFTRFTPLNKSVIQVDEWLSFVIDEQDLEKEIKVSHCFQLENRSISVDVERLQRVIVNVVTNSRYAVMNENKVVVEGAKLEIKTQVGSKRIEIIITDNGIGMNDEVLLKIFEPLFSTRSYGLGLGMPIIKQIMQQHNGDVEITSKIGVGTSVLLWLPITDD